jgi:hypothetical protein
MRSLIAIYISGYRKFGNILIFISEYRERVIHPLFAILEILPTYSPNNAVVGVVLSQKWKKSIYPECLKCPWAPGAPWTFQKLRVDTLPLFPYHPSDCVGAGEYL